MLAYDALRAFSILSVVAIHCFMPLRSVLPDTSLQLIIDDLLHYAVPVFVFISGALVWGRPLRTTYMRFLFERLRWVGLPYLAWALAYLALLLLTTDALGSTLLRAPWLLLTGHVWYHLYFIPMLLGFYLMTPVAVRLIHRWPSATLVMVYAVRIELWPTASAWLRVNAPELAWSYATHLATHLPHMVLGAWFALMLPKIPQRVIGAWLAPLGLGTAILLARILGVVPRAHSPAAYALGMAATVLGMAFAAYSLEPRFDRFERVVVAGAALSFGVYFVHPMWLLALERGVSAASAESLWMRWWAVPVAWALVSAASYATAWLLARSGRTAWLVGVKAGTGG
ncbi:MAG: acyltransferase [Coriobacteriia bacterium]|nr:acyltransferase [Coriobacteriia bacterium]